MVNKDSVRQELQRILVSRAFEGKRQASHFLEYVVMETLAGRGDKITQYGIAVEALGKPADYCPTENPAVRVEAGRVRKLLDDYYMEEGRQCVLRIVLPVGRYTPTFQPVSKYLSTNTLDKLEKSIQSVGPRIYLSCQNPATIRDDAARNLMYSLNANLPMVLGRCHEVRVALADPTVAPSSLDEELDYAWQQHKAEFLLKLEVQPGQEGLLLKQMLLHTLSHEWVWENTVVCSHLGEPKVLESFYTQLTTEAFSLQRGAALAYWSRYWLSQSAMPAHYQVLVQHIHFVQVEASVLGLRRFLQVCQERTHQYHDDALAHLHFAVLCLYARLLNFYDEALQPEQWRSLALKALALNPGNALAHGMVALECFQRGDVEHGQVALNTARQTNPNDVSCGHLLAVGLCALRYWELAFALLGEVTGDNSRYPQPLRSIPCLYHFRQGRFVAAASDPLDFAQLGGWGTFGRLSEHCRAGHCQRCIQDLGNATADCETGVIFSPTSAPVTLDSPPKHSVYLAFSSQ